MCLLDISGGRGEYRLINNINSKIDAFSVTIVHAPK